VYTLKAQVRNGRLVLNEPTTLPEGTELLLEVVVSADDVREQNRAALHAALDEAEAEIEAGQVVSESEMWASLRMGK
jgi:hypothetical protein